MSKRKAEKNSLFLKHFIWFLKPQKGPKLTSTTCQDGSGHFGQFLPHVVLCGSLRKKQSLKSFLAFFRHLLQLVQPECGCFDSIVTFRNRSVRSISTEFSHMVRKRWLIMRDVNALKKVRLQLGLRKKPNKLKKNYF